MSGSPITAAAFQSRAGDPLAGRLRALQCRRTAYLGGSPVGGTERRSTSFGAAAGFVTRVGSVCRIRAACSALLLPPRRFRSSEAIWEPGFAPFTGFGSIRGPRPLALGSLSVRNELPYGPGLQPEFGAGSLEGSAVPCGGGQVDAGVAGPVAYRFAERLELVGVFVAAADVGELFDDVTELLDVDGVAASPATPQVERFDLSSQGSDVVDGVVELLAHVVAMQRRGGLVGVCSCLVVVLDVCGGVSSGAFEVFGRCFELRGSGVVVAAGVARRPRMPLWSRWCWARAWRRHASS